MKKRKVDRSAVSGQFVTHDEAVAKPSETITQTVAVGERDPTPSVLKSYICDPEPLNFISETDSYWQVWALIGKKPRVINPDIFLGLVGGTFCTALDFKEWTQHVITSQGVSQGPEVAERYANLFEACVELFATPYVFKVGISAHRFDYFCVGVDFQNHLLGVHAQAVET